MGDADSPDDRTVVVSRVSTTQETPLPAAAPPPKKSKGKTIAAGCGGCLLLVVLAAGIGAFMAMRGGKKVPFLSPGKVTVHGTVFNSAKKPFTGGHVRVVVHSPSGGKPADFTAAAGADGRYSISVPGGPCTLEAWADVAAGGKSVAIPLTPLSVVTGTSICSGDLPRDFQWQLAGVRPGGNASTSADHLGGFVELTADPPTSPGDAPVSIRFVPGSPMLDGTEAQPVTIDSTVMALSAASLSSELPLGTWTVSASSPTATGAEVLLVDGQAEKAADLLLAGPGSSTPIHISSSAAQPAATTTEEVPPPPPPPTVAPSPRPKPVARKPRPRSSPAPTATSAPPKPEPAASAPPPEEKKEDTAKEKEKPSGFKGKMQALRDKFRRHPKDTDKKAPP
jgi:hypothetical protein